MSTNNSSSLFQSRAEQYNTIYWHTLSKPETSDPLNFEISPELQEMNLKSRQKAEHEFKVIDWIRNLAQQNLLNVCTSKFYFQLCDGSSFISYYLKGIKNNFTVNITYECLSIAVFQRDIHTIFNDDCWYGFCNLVKFEEPPKQLDLFEENR